MVNKIDPTKKVTPSLEGNTEGENNSSSEMSSFQGIGSLLNKLVEKSAEIATSIKDNPNGFAFILSLLFVIAFVSISISLLFKELNTQSFQIVFYGGVGLFSLIITSLLMGLVHKIFDHFDNKRTSKKNQKNTSFEREIFLSLLLDDNQKEFIKIYNNGKYENLKNLQGVEKITRKMLEKGQFDSIRKNEVTLNNYISSGVYKESTHRDFIESTPPLDASKIYAMQLVYQKEKTIINLNLHRQPVLNSDQNWWEYPWSEVLINIALISNTKSASLIVKQLVFAYNKNGRENSNALQTACRIVLSIERIEKQALIELLEAVYR